LRKADPEAPHDQSVSFPAWKACSCWGAFSAGAGIRRNPRCSIC